LLARGLDYVAMGDWHGVLGYGDRLWYSGTPEPTRFKEKEPGYALLVEIDGPKEPPRVTRLQVARTRWLQEHRALDSTADLDALAEWFDGLPERSWTLVELSLEGALSYGDLDRLDRLLEQQAEELLWLRVRSNQVRVAPTEEDLARLNAEGFIGDAVQQLRAAAEQGGPAGGVAPGVPGPKDRAPGAHSPAVHPTGAQVRSQSQPQAQAAQDALRLLYRFIHEEGAA
jgi:hypothetical protein